MKFLEIFLIAVGLAMDAVAVSIVAASMGFANNPRAVFRLSFHFGLFQFLMPLIGWSLGRTVIDYIATFDHWLAFALLSFVGIRMIQTCFGDKIVFKRDPSRGSMMVSLSFATSIDALAVGISLAMLDLTIWYPCFVIGIVTSFLSLLGIRFGKYLGRRFSTSMGFLGGFILIGIGLRILLSHLLTTAA